MNEINKILMILLLIVYSSVEAFASISEIDTCKKLDVDGEYYFLNKNVESDGTCFTISANNITLDGTGYWANFSNLIYGYGIRNIKHDNVTIKNININQINQTLIGSKGISFDNSSNGLISNVTIDVYMEGINFHSYNNNNTIINTTVTSNRSAAIFLYLSNNNTIINSTGISTTSDNIYLRNAMGIQLAFSNNNTIVNSMGMSTNIGGGINICERSNNNIIINSIGKGTSNTGLSITSSSNNTIINSTGISNTGTGLHITSSSNNNTIINGNFTSIDDESVIIDTKESIVPSKNIGTKEPIASSKNIITALLVIVLSLVFILILFDKKSI